MKLVRITKLAEVAEPVCPAAPWEDFKPGLKQHENLSLPVAYEAEGYLLYPIEVGKPVTMERIRRNGVEAWGIFRTTIVTNLGKGFFDTTNSHYKIENV